MEWLDSRGDSSLEALKGEGSSNSTFGPGVDSLHSTMSSSGKYGESEDVGSVIFVGDRISRSTSRATTTCAETDPECAETKPECAETSHESAETKSKCAEIHWATKMRGTG